jgi:hypothetical protein
MIVAQGFGPVDMGSPAFLEYVQSVAARRA